ncbi:HNH endonuclease signature motif containing protein [Pseudonocardia acaciae]|uniref:HNH endonuclease n=1 Tax=Pseudonocardia acaciae TaxID=551276 RepID=UPI000A0613C0
MPTRPPRVCPRCRRPVSGRCPTCQPSPSGWAARPSKAWINGSTRRWRRLRAAKLADQPLCEQCGALAHEVDHITSLGEGGDRYDWTNLQSLCTPCHQAKTLAESARALAARRAADAAITASTEPHLS